MVPLPVTLSDLWRSLQSLQTFSVLMCRIIQHINSMRLTTTIGCRMWATVSNVVCNGLHLHAAHLHWIKERSMRPGTLEAVWERHGYYRLLMKRYVACWTALLPVSLSDLQCHFKIITDYQKVTNKPNRIQQQYKTADDECHTFGRPSQWHDIGPCHRF